MNKYSLNEKVEAPSTANAKIRLICAKCGACAGHPEDRDGDKCKHCGERATIAQERDASGAWITPNARSHDPSDSEVSVDSVVGGDCATCENNDADVVGDSGACIMGHGLCDPPQRGCLDYVPANMGI